MPMKWSPRQGNQISLAPIWSGHCVITHTHTLFEAYLSGGYPYCDFGGSRLILSNFFYFYIIVLYYVIVLV